MEGAEDVFLVEPYFVDKLYDKVIGNHIPSPNDASNLKRIVALVDACSEEDKKKDVFLKAFMKEYIKFWILGKDLSWEDGVQVATREELVTYLTDLKKYPTVALFNASRGFVYYTVGCEGKVEEIVDILSVFSLTPLERNTTEEETLGSYLRYCFPPVECLTRNASDDNDMEVLCAVAEWKARVEVGRIRMENLDVFRSLIPDKLGDVEKESLFAIATKAERNPSSLPQYNTWGLLWKDGLHPDLYWFVHCRYDDAVGMCAEAGYELCTWESLSEDKDDVGDYGIKFLPGTVVVGL